MANLFSTIKTNIEHAMNSTAPDIHTTRTEEAYNAQLKNRQLNSDTRNTKVNVSPFHETVLKYKNIHDKENTSETAFRKTTNAEYKPLCKNDITGTLPVDQPTIAIVDNATGNRGSWITDYGYVHCTADGLNDGDVVFLDNKGNYTFYSDDEMSEDYKSMVDKYKSDHGQAKDDFELSKKFQDMAREEQEKQEHLGAGQIVVDMFNLYLENTQATELVNLGIAENSEETIKEGLALKDTAVEHAESTVDYAKDFVYDLQVAQAWRDNHSIVDWKADYKSNPKKTIDAIMNSDMSDRQKEYISWSLVTDTDRDFQAYFIPAVLKDMLGSAGQIMDLLHGTDIVKSAVAALDSENNYLGLNGTNSFTQNVENTLRASWQNEGRKVYNYDTGVWAFDLVLEMVSDPETLISVAKHLTKVAAVDDIVKNSVDIDRKAVKSALHGDLSEKSIDEVVDIIVKEAGVEAQAGVREVLTDVLETSKMYQLTESLYGVSHIIDTLDSVIMNCCTGAAIKYPAKLLWMSGSKLSEIAETSLGKVVKAFNDGIAETLGKTATDKVTIDTAQQSMDYVSKNIAAMKHAGQLDINTDYFDDAAKVEYISNIYLQDLEDLKATGAAPEAFQQLAIDTQEVLSKNGLEDSTLMLVLRHETQPDIVLDYASTPTWARIADAKLNDNTYLDVVNKEFKTLPRTDIDSATTPMSFVPDDAKLYAPKLNEVEVSNAIMADDTIRTVCSGFSGNNNTSQTLLKIINSTESEATKEVVADMTKHSVGIQNYDTLVNGIKNSNVIDPEMKRGLIDSLHNESFKNTISRTFAYGNEGITEVQIYEKSRSLARKLVEKQKTMEATYAGYESMAHLNCNTLSLDDNVENIFKTFDNTAIYAESPLSKDITHVAYSVEIKDGNVTEVVIKVGKDGRPEHFKLYDHLNDDFNWDVCNQFDSRLLELRSTGSHAGKQVKFVGCNNHASGFDTDYVMNRWFKQHRMQACNFLRGTQDVAEDARVMKHLILPTEDSTYDELTDMFVDCTHNWLKNDLAFKSADLHAPFSVTPPALKDLRYWMDTMDTMEQLPADKSTADFLQDLYTHLDETCIKINDAHAHVIKNVGLIPYTDDLFKTLGKKSKDLAVSKIFERKTIENWFMTDNFTVIDGINRFKMSQRLDTILSTYREPRFFVQFEDDINRMYTTYLDMIQRDFITGNPKAIQRYSERGLVNGQGIYVFNASTTQKKCAVLQYIWTEFPEFKRGKVFLGDDYKFVSALNRPYDCITRPIQRYYHPDEVLRGSIDNKFSTWNTERTLQQAIDNVNDNIRDIESIDVLREASGLTGELDTVTKAYRNKLREPYEALIEDIRKGSYAPTAVESKVWDSPYETWWNRGLQKQSNYDAFYEGTNTLYHDQQVSNLAYVQALDDVQFTRYLQQCNNRMVIDLSEFNIKTKSSFLDSLNARTLKGYEIKKTDDIITILGPQSKKVARSKIELPEAVNRRTSDGLAMRVDNMTKEMRKYNDVSFTYGQYIPNDAKTHMFVAQKYFDGLDISDIAEETRVGSYYAGYIGPINGLLGEGSYASGDMLANLINSYNRSIQHLDNMQVLNEIVMKDNMFNNMITKPDDAKRMLNAIDDEGYSIIVPTIKGEYKVLDLDFTSAEHIMKLEHCAVMRADEAQALVTRVHDLRNKNAGALLKTFNKLRSVQCKMYIQNMLFTVTGTGIRNWIDSPLKALLAEGPEHLRYMKLAAGLIHNSRDVFDNIAKRFPDTEITSELIDRLAKEEHFFDAVGGAENFKRILAYKNSTISGAAYDKYLLDKISDMDGKLGIFKFNQFLFSSAESVNRLAIFLKHTDAGDTYGAAYKAIKETQFDYSKATSQAMLDTLMPFSAFQLMNFKFWAIDLWTHKNAMQFMGDLPTLFGYTQDDQGAYHDWYWSEDQLRMRAWIDTLDPKQYEESSREYNQFRDYMGVSDKSGKANGYSKIGKHFWINTGISFLDAFTGMERFLPISGTSGMEDSMFILFRPSTWNGETFKKIENEIKLAATDQITLDQFVNDVGYDVASMIPFIGTALSAAMTISRNALFATRNDMTPILTVLTTLGSIVGLKPASVKEYSNDNTYLNRPFGVDWYNQSEEYRKTHRYVTGLSYAASWMSKDPATYINTVGRLQQILGSKDGAYEFMQLGNGFWFTKEDNEYKLHNYKLMIGDEETRSKLLDSLVNKFGWGIEDANTILDEWSIPTWKQKSWAKINSKRSNATGITGPGRYSKATVNSIRYAYLNQRPRVGINRDQQAPGAYRMDSRLRQGKNVQYTHSYTPRAVAAMNHDIARMKWHQRSRNIYTDNYARYGASRMAMEQNLKNYSNRSITEMRRTNQNLRYSQIHRHTRWF